MNSVPEAGWATYEELVAQDLSTLAGLDLGLVSLGGVRSEVNSGGFDQYFLNSAGDLAEVAVDWAQRKDHPDLAGLVQRAMQAFGEPYPSDRQPRLARLLEMADDAFESLDQEYFLLEAAIDLDSLMDDIAESRYWVQLEERITAELRESGRSDLRGFWCDGIGPTSYGLTEDPPKLEGSIYLGRDGQEQWELTLIAPRDRAAQALTKNIWEPLLPLDDTTGWLTADPDTKTLRIDLAKTEPVGGTIEVHPKTGRVRPAKHRPPPHQE